MPVRFGVVLPWTAYQTLEILGECLGNGFSFHESSNSCPSALHVARFCPTFEGWSPSKWFMFSKTADFEISKWMRMRFLLPFLWRLFSQNLSGRFAKEILDVRVISYRCREWKRTNTNFSLLCNELGWQTCFSSCNGFPLSFASD